MKHVPDFPSQRPNEKLILLVRRHWTRIVYYITKLVGGAIIPIILFIFFFYAIDFEITSDLSSMIMTFAISVYYLFIFLFFLHDFIDYQLDVWVVTDQRIINIEQEGLFNRVVSSQSIERVQDVTSEVKGKVATFLDYGNVYIQTAGEEQRFVFEEVPNPAKIMKIIQDVHDRVEEQEEREDREELVRALKESGVKHVSFGAKDLSAEPAIDTPIKKPTRMKPQPIPKKKDENSIF